MTAGGGSPKDRKGRPIPESKVSTGGEKEEWEILNSLDMAAYFEIKDVFE